MKVLFLDVDGVLNSDETTERHDGWVGLDQTLVQRFFSVFTPAACLGWRIVVSSTWRLYPDMFAAVLSLSDSAEFLCNEDGTAASTPDLHVSHMARGREIKAWLKDHPEVNDYIILDDDRDILKEQLAHALFTDGRKGLTNDDAERLRQRLNSDLCGVLPLVK